ncbi:MAG: translation initiation factor IF-2 [Acidobacteria bacterium]|nr:translation initiation factor IF-2 [Acidobacteriota bacterium]
MRVVKKAKVAEADEAPHDEEGTTAAEEASHAGEVYAAPEHDAPTAAAAEPHAELPPEGTSQGGAVRQLVPRVIRKLPTAARAERPEGAAVQTDTGAQETEEQMITAPSASVESDAPSPIPFIQPQNGDFPAAALATEEAAEPESAEEAPAEATSPAAPLPGRQVRVLRPTSAALSAGIQAGQRVTAPAAPAAAATPAARDRAGRVGRDERGGRGRGREELNAAPRGTPGETATPQTVYTPPADARRPGSRPGRRPVGRPGHGRGVETRGGRFDRDFIVPPKALSREERIAQSLNIPSGGGGGELKAIRLIEGSTVKEFAEKLGIKPKDVVALLMQRGVLATINQPLNADVAGDIGRRFGFEISFVDFEEMVAEEEFEEIIGEGIEDYVEESRAPVVTVMGHVDHGKTSLLDGIRATDVAGGEAGGITQHIGAYSVQVKSPDDPTQLRRVVFLDTPGHEAFTMMRARGAKATDVVVLVVAADDGVMPQTVEAIEHARAAGVPIVVAINKIDRPDANPDRVRQELAGHGLQPVEWGGETEMVPVSAKKRENLDTLLETILLTTDILNLRASPSRLAAGVVLEAKLDRGRGSVATVLVQQGTLRVHDPFIVGQIFGKVRAMFNDRGEAIQEAGPATPVEVLGLQGVPQAGESFQVVADITKAQQISHHRQMITRQNTLLQTTKRGIEALGAKEVKELLIIVKADVQGSVEVLKSTLQKLSTEVVKVRVIRSGAGAITESDVLLAAATQTEAAGRAVVIIGFNVRPEVRAAELAKQEHVDIRLHSIIYKVEEEIRAAMIGMLEAIESERITGTALVQEVFRVPRVGVVAGCRVLTGMIRRNGRARLIRDGVVAWEGNIGSLRRFKDDVSEVRDGYECGIGLENFGDIKENDQIEAYVIDKVAATEL